MGSSIPTCTILRVVFYNFQSLASQRWSSPVFGSFLSVFVVYLFVSLWQEILLKYCADIPYRYCAICSALHHPPVRQRVLQRSAITRFLGKHLQQQILECGLAAQSLRDWYRAVQDHMDKFPL